MMRKVLRRKNVARTDNFSRKFCMRCERTLLQGINIKSIQSFADNTYPNHLTLPALGVELAKAFLVRRRDGLCKK